MKKNRYLAVAALLALPLLHAQTGQLDPSFDGDGRVVTASLSDQLIYALAIQPDGKIVVAGSIYQGLDNDFILLRFMPDGSPDPGFNGTGMVITDFGGDDVARCLALQPDGKIVAAGVSANDFAVARYTASGMPDSSFSLDGRLTTMMGPAPDQVNAVLIQGDLKILVAGGSRNGTNDFAALARYMPSGTLDQSFGVNGKVFGDMAPGADIANDMALLPDGRIVVAGANDDGNDTDAGLMRFLPDGSPDSSFGINGTVISDFSPVSDAFTSLAITPAGIIIAGGNLYQSGETDFLIAGYLPDGTPDNSFSGNGMLTEDFEGSDDGIRDIGIQPDGRIIATGYATGANFLRAFTLARYTAAGTPDISFGSAGKVITDFEPLSDEAHALAIQQDGKLVVAGYTDHGFTFSAALARYTTGLTGIGETVAPALPLSVSPNPVDGFSQIEYRLETAGNVTVSITDLQGRTVRTLVSNQQQQSGVYRLELHPGDLPGAGTYFVTVAAGFLRNVLPVIAAN